MKKILFLGTGGTFASVRTKKGLQPRFNYEELLDKFPKIKKRVEIKGLQLCNFDSTNLEPKYWTLIAKAIAKNYDKFDAFIIGHGTDTMHYSAAALSFALQGVSKPIVFTGATFPFEDLNTDAKINFIDSVKVAESGLVKDICIVFQHKIFKATNSRKVTNEATKIVNVKLDVFSNINTRILGKIAKDKIILFKSEDTKSHNKSLTLRLIPNFDPNIGLIKLFPGIKSEVLDYYNGKKAIIIMAFGPGNIPFEYSNWIEKIKTFSKKGTPIFITTQVPFGEVDMKMYEVGQKAEKAGAISSINMITETAIVKLMWILGNYPKYDLKKIKNLFLKNICGELSNN